MLWPCGLKWEGDSIRSLSVIVRRGDRRPWKAAVDACVDARRQRRLSLEMIWCGPLRTLRKGTGPVGKRAAWEVGHARVNTRASDAHPGEDDPRIRSTWVPSLRYWSARVGTTNSQRLVGGTRFYAVGDDSGHTGVEQTVLL